MISDAEWHKLAEIEMALRRDDPVFVQRFDEPRLTPHRRRIGARLAISVVLAVTALAIALGVAAAAILGPSAMDSMQSPSIHKEVTHGH
jgi:Protein of unknown function (DUF3040)